MIYFLIGLLCIFSFLFAAYIFPFIVAFAVFCAAGAGGLGKIEAALAAVTFGLVAEWMLTRLLVAVSTYARLSWTADGLMPASRRSRHTSCDASPVGIARH